MTKHSDKFAHSARQSHQATKQLKRRLNYEEIDFQINLTSTIYENFILAAI